MHDLDLLVLNDFDTMLFKKVGLRPGFYPTPQCGRVVIVPEGDLGGGLATYILRLLSGGHVNFIEPFHIDLPGENFAAGHAGPNDYTDEGVTLVSRDVRFAKREFWIAPFRAVVSVSNSGLRKNFCYSFTAHQFVKKAFLTN